MKRRFVFNDIIKFLYGELNKIVILTGSRQVGKTTLLMQIQKYLQNENKKVYYLTMEDPDALSDLNENPKNILQYIDLEKQCYLLIDEIQYLDDPTHFLKYLYDMYKNKIRILCTGSSAIFIDNKFRDSLAGRKIIFNLPTMNFKEYIYFKYDEKIINNIENQKITKSLIRMLGNSFIEYCKWGGYPEVVTTNSDENRIIILRDLVNSFTKRDVVEMNIKNTFKFYQLMKLLSNQIGSMLNKNEISKLLGISSNTVNNYIYALRKSFHISLINPKYKNLSKEIIKMPKLYYNDIGFRNYLINDFRVINDRQDKGSIFESIFIKHFNTDFEIKFWRQKNGPEIDFIVQDKFAFEIKSSCRNIVNKNLEKFRSKYPNIPVKALCFKHYYDTNNSLLHYLISDTDKF